MKTVLRSVIALSLLAAGAAQASNITVTSIGDTPVANEWYRANYRDTSTGHQANTVAAITNSNPRSGNGSIEMSMAPLSAPGSPQGQGKADFMYYWGYDSSRTLGTLSTLGFDWNRGDDTAAAHFAPALRLSFDADGVNDGKSDRGYLIWELTYQGTGVSVAPKNDWYSPDMMAGDLYQRRPSPIGEIPGYDLTLADWKNGVTPAGALTLGADTAILGIEFGIGSGWSGAFVGYVDNVRFGFGAESNTYNFELPAGEVPEPASLVLLGLGALGLAAARRRKLS